MSKNNYALFRYYIPLFCGNEMTSIDALMDLINNINGNIFTEYSELLFFEQNITLPKVNISKTQPSRWQACKKQTIVSDEARTTRLSIKKRITYQSRHNDLLVRQGTFKIYNPKYRNV